jgi:hypothetical protein
MRILRRALRRLLGLLIGHVMADYAPADRAEDAMMGHMAGDAADKRAFEAALRFGGSGRKRRGERQSERSGHDECGLHDRIPFLSVPCDADGAPDRASAWL